MLLVAACITASSIIDTDNAAVPIIGGVGDVEREYWGMASALQQGVVQHCITVTIGIYNPRSSFLGRGDERLGCCLCGPQGLVYRRGRCGWAPRWYTPGKIPKHAFAASRTWCSVHDTYIFIG